MFHALFHRPLHAQERDAAGILLEFVLQFVLLLAVVVADNFLFAAPTSTSHAAASIFTHADAASTLANLFSVMVNGYKGPGSTNQTQIISKTGTHRSQQSTLLQLFFATQCYT